MISYSGATFQMSPKFADAELRLERELAPGPSTVCFISACDAGKAASPGPGHGRAAAGPPRLTAGHISKVGSAYSCIFCIWKSKMHILHILHMSCIYFAYFCIFQGHERPCLWLHIFAYFLHIYAYVCIFLIAYICIFYAYLCICMHIFSIFLHIMVYFMHIIAYSCLLILAY